MDQLRPELDNVLQCLSLNGYSVFSLIDDILAHRDWEDERIKRLREGIERDAADICARLLRHTTSSPERVSKSGTVVQCHIVKNHRHTVPIDILPDNVLLDIFNFCLYDPELLILHVRSWQTLVHVCQKWRGIIFASPRRLDLHLYCSYGVPVRKNLALWPVTLPLIVNYSSMFSISAKEEDNIVAALEHPTRVDRITIIAATALIKKVATALQKSFPALVHLELACDDYPTHIPGIPKGFLGGTAPHLQHLTLKFLSFPQLPALLLSARDLITLNLDPIPPNGDMSPESMVRILAVLPRLTTLLISFYEETSSYLWGSQPDFPKRAILPALTRFVFTGCSEYLEDLLSRIDTPRVNDVMIVYSMPHIQASQLSRFIERTKNLNLDQFTRVETVFGPDESYVELNCPRRKYSLAPLSLKLLGQESSLETQVQNMADVLGQLVARFSKVDDLFFRGGDHHIPSGRDITEWMPLFRLFPAVETLRLSGKVGENITSVLGDTAEEMVTDVFPVLCLIYLAEDKDEEKDEYEEDEEDDWREQVISLERFLSFRELSGCPVTVFVEAEQRWQENFL